MYLGIVEGFYGPMWDKLDRISMLDFMYRAGMNIYIYGPKWDPYHRERWRAPYPSSYEDMFLELNDMARRRGVETVYALSPGLSIRYGDERDLALVIRKLERMMSLGFPSIALFLDDIPPEIRGGKYGSLAEAQASLVNRVYDELSPDHMLFCPTFYWGVRKDYLAELGELLDPKIMIMWTGPAIVSIRITARDVEEFIEAAGRKPFIWNNYPVNDYFLLHGAYRLHLGPFMNRDPEIWGLIEGYAANPMSQAEASKIPLYTLCKMKALGRNYDPWKSLEEAIDKLFPDEEKPVIKEFVELNKASPFDPLGDRVPGKEDAGRLIKLVEGLMRIGNHRFLEEIMYAIAKLRAIAAHLSGMEARLDPAIQVAGDYVPPIDPGSMKTFFGEVIKTRRVWVKN